MNIGALFKIKAGVDGLEEVRRLHDETARVKNQGAELGRVFSSVKGQIAAAFSVGAVVAFMKTTVTAAMEAEQASARLDATLRATGGSAGIMRRELDDLAEQLQKDTGFDDESIRNASAQFLKFGNIQKGVFEEGIKLSADLAALMGTDVVTAAHTVGKALSSPAEGMGALERSVGKFSQSQRESIKQMAEAGNVAGAQAEILKILQQRIGGTAGSVHSGLTKDVKDLANAFGDLAEAIGKSGPVSGGGGGILRAAKNELTAIKELIEQGTWFDRLYYWSGSLALENVGRAMVGLPGRGASPGSRDPNDYGDESARMLARAPAPQEIEKDFSLKDRERDVQGWVKYVEALETEWEDGLRMQAEVNEKYYEVKDRQRDADAAGWVKYIEALEGEWEDGLNVEAAATAKFYEEQDRLRERSEADWIKYIDALNEQWEDELKGNAAAMEDQEKDWKKMRDVIEGWGKDASRAFVDWASGAKVSIKDVVATMLKEFATMMLYRNVFGPLFGMGADFASGFFGAGAGGAAAGGFGGGAVVAHTGLDSGRRRSVNMGVFRGAPRLHNGLAADEFPAILQRGESVIPKGRGGAGMQVNVAVSVDANGASVDATDELGAKLGQSIAAGARAVLVDEMRPGGLLSGM